MPDELRKRAFADLPMSEWVLLRDEAIRTDKHISVLVRELLAPGIEKLKAKHRRRESRDNG